MNLVQLRAAATVDDLASALGFSTYDALAAFVYPSPGVSRYRVFNVPKRSGGLRQISAPAGRLKAIQRQILPALVEAYCPTRSAFGFVPRRSIVGNAERHKRRAVVVNVDLADFFPSISFSRVRGLFMTSPFSLTYEVATVLAHICCFGGRLPQGSPTSPIISNFICSSLDRQLGAIVGSTGGKYSRYCDDMTMSFHSLSDALREVISPSPAGYQLGQKVLSIIGQSGFAINQQKFKVRTNRERQEVTGLVVNEFVNVRREFVRKVASALHCVEKFGQDLAAEGYFERIGMVPNGQPAPALRRRIRGQIDFIKMIRGEGDRIHANLARRFNAVFRPKAPVRYFQRVDRPSDLAKAVWVVEVEYDDEEFGLCISQGTAFCLEGVGVVTCAHVVIDERSGRPFKEISIHRQGSLDKKVVHVASFDHRSDAALLLVDGVDYRSEMDVRFALASGSAQPGVACKAIGFPSYREGQSVYVAEARVAARHNRRFEIDADIIGGISGGPVVDSGYRVLGFCAKGIPGGGSKNEVVDIREAQYLQFNYQDIQAAGQRVFLELPTPKGFFRRLFKAAADRLVMLRGLVIGSKSRR